MGGARVWYVEDPGPVAASIQAQVQARVDAGVDPEDSFWRLTPFIDFAKPDSVWEDWRWEREWRVPNGLRFQPEDVAFLFLPEESHSAARQFFVDHQVANTGPAYLCPYIDPHWPKDRIEKALQDVSAPEPPPDAINDRSDPRPFGV
jgi:hypothetical protein